MAENYHHHHHPEKEKPTRPSRLGLRTAGAGAGEIVEVEGGHIVRSTGRKDRHSKVCTAKGPRDRRVRLSAHTAIQFYDVQDRLGYDRPSKAVDWLIKKAKTAIDELAELPAWKPTNSSVSAGILNFEQNHHPDEENLTNRGFDEHPDDEIADNQMGNPQNPTFLNLDSNSIANTIKSFFPVGGASSTTPPPPPSSDMQFHHHFPPPELISRPTNQNQNQNQNQDLNLSLQSFQDPILHHHHQPPPPPPHHHGNNNMFFDGSGWPENHPGGFQRLVAWGGGGGGGGDGVSSTGFVFGSPTMVQPPMFLQPLFGQPTNNQLFNYISQRGPLQSSNSPPVRAWVDPPQPPSFSGEYSGMFPGFHIPARIQGEDDDEEHDGISDKPSSASSDSRD